MQAVYQMIETVAATNSTILITGESGTGKELVARAIHSLSNRAAAPFVSINCGAFTETLLESELFGYMKGAFTGAVSNRKGLFEAAEGGTIFLDEIGETTPAMQVKMLRVLQERCIRRVGGVEEIPVDVRVVAATNRALALEQGRIAGLDRRREDQGPPPGVPDRRMRPEWLPERILKFKPRNMAELELPDDGIDLEAYLMQLEKDYILKALQRTGGNQTRAAEVLKMSVRSLRHLLDKHKIRQTASLIRESGPLGDSAAHKG